MTPLPDRWRRVRRSLQPCGALWTMRRLAACVPAPPSESPVGALGWDLAIWHLAARVVEVIDDIDALTALGCPTPGTHGRVWLDRGAAP